MSTSITDLPTDPANGGTIGGNISLSTSENAQGNSNASPSSLSLDQTTINQIINGLQQAGSSTALPSRDIPRNVESITHDEQIQPNFIPKASSNDYIKENEENDDIIYNYNKNAQQGDSLDQLYEEIQIPLLISVIYFLFQLPIFKSYLYHFFPVLFMKDGNMGLYGYFFTSSLFGLLYYLLSKITTHFSRF
jgi:hypothetical protein